MTIKKYHIVCAMNVEELATAVDLFIRSASSADLTWTEWQPFGQPFLLAERDGIAQAMVRYAKG